MVWAVSTGSKHRRAVTDCQHSFGDQTCKGTTLLCAVSSCPNRPPESPGDLDQGVLSLGNPQPFHKFLNVTGELRQHIPSRQISFAHWHLSEQLLQLLGWNATPLFQRFTSKPSKMQFQTATTSRLLYMGFVLKHGLLTVSFLPLLPSTGHVIPLCCHICLFPMSLWLFPLRLMPLTFVSSTWKLLLLH